MSADRKSRSTLNWPVLAGQRPTTGRLEPGISSTDVSLRSPTWPHIPRKFTRQSHLASANAPKRLFSRPGSASRVGSIPIARSTFRCLASPYVVLGRVRAFCPVPTVSMRLQPVFWRSNVHSRLIDSVDRPVGRARAPWSLPSVTDPFLSLVTGSFEAVKNTEPYERWGILGLAGIAFRVATVFCENTAQKFAGARSPIYGL